MSNDQHNKNLILKIEKLTEEKEQEIKNKNFERAAQLRDSIRAAVEELEDRMNPSEEKSQ